MQNQLYQNIKNRWQNSEATINGVLGGFAELNQDDINDSIEFLEDLLNQGFVSGFTALDSCAGIGRVTHFVLQKYFSEIDLFDQEQKFINQAKINFINNSKISEIKQCSIQDFEFTKKYDLIWLQWNLENLEDDDLIRFLKKCKNNLNENGLIIVKENICPDQNDYIFGKDYKIRSKKALRNFFEICNLKIVKESQAEKWPQDLFQVANFALK